MPTDVASRTRGCYSRVAADAPLFRVRAPLGRGLTGIERGRAIRKEPRDDQRLSFSASFVRWQDRSGLGAQPRFCSQIGLMSGRDRVLAPFRRCGQWRSSSICARARRTSLALSSVRSGCSDQRAGTDGGWFPSCSADRRESALTRAKRSNQHQTQAKARPEKRIDSTP
jgi:hypothetical protein